MSGFKDYSDGVTAQASFQHSDGAHLSDSAFDEARLPKEKAPVGKEQASGIANVVSQFAGGVGSELIHDPFGLVISGFVGAEVGLVAKVGLKVFPKTTYGLLALGGVTAAYDIACAAPEWCKNVGIAFSPEKHALSEVNEAEKGLQRMGARSLDFVAAGIGGSVGYKFGESCVMPTRFGVTAMKSWYRNAENVVRTTLGGEPKATASLAEDIAAVKMAATKVNSKAVFNTSFVDKNEAGSAIGNIAYWHLVKQRPASTRRANAGFHLTSIF